MLFKKRCRVGMTSLAPSVRPHTTCNLRTNSDYKFDVMLLLAVEQRHAWRGEGRARGRRQEGSIHGRTFVEWGSEPIDGIADVPIGWLWGGEVVVLSERGLEASSNGTKQILNGCDIAQQQQPARMALKLNREQAVGSALRCSNPEN